MKQLTILSGGSKITQTDDKKKHDWEQMHWLLNKVHGFRVNKNYWKLEVIAKVLKMKGKTNYGILKFRLIKPWSIPSQTYCH